MFIKLKEITSRPICKFLKFAISELVLSRIHLLEEKKVKTDRKSTRLNSSHANISYAVFCLKKKKKIQQKEKKRKKNETKHHYTMTAAVRDTANTSNATEPE